MNSAIPEPWAAVLREIGQDQRDWGALGPDMNRVLALALEELQRRRFRITQLLSEQRERFAASALQGLLAGRGTFGGVETIAIEIADNMVAALKP